MEIPNSQRKVVKIWSWLGVFFFALCFLPAMTDMDMMQKGFAIVTLSGFAVVVCLIVVAVYAQRAKQFDELINGNNVLASWTLSSQEWSSYAEYDYQKDKTAKLQLFYLITVISLVIGISLAVISQDILFIYIILALIAVMAITAALSIYFGHRKNLTQTGYVIISPFSILLNGDFHNWTSLGASLESLTYIDDLIPPVIELTYSFPSRVGREEATVRIPVPDKEKANVRRILEAIIAANQL
jgi:hypothetical protein